MEDFQNALIIGVVHIRVGNLVPAGAQGGGGVIEQVLQLLRVLLVHDHQLIVQHALDAVEGAVNLGDVFVFQSGPDDAVGAGIDDGGRTAGLADDDGTGQSFGRHLYYLQEKYKKFRQIVQDAPAFGHIRRNDSTKCPEWQIK